MADGKKPHPLAGTVVLPEELDPAKKQEAERLTEAQKKATLPIPDDVVARLREHQRATPFAGEVPPTTSHAPSADATTSFQDLVRSPPQNRSFDPEDLDATMAMSGNAPTPGVVPNPHVDPLHALAAQQQEELPLDGTMAVHGQPSQMGSPFHIAGPDDTAATAAPIPGAPWAGEDEARAKARDDEARRQAEDEAKRRAEEAGAKREADAARALEEQRAREAEERATQQAAARAEQERLAAEERRREEAEAFRREQEAAKEAELRRKEERKEERAKKAAALRKGMYGGFGSKG